MDFNKDYYIILGVPKSATKLELKAAYRKLVSKYHPDLNQGNAEATEKIKAINEAYEVLTDDISRQIYDEYKMKAEKNESERLGKSAIPKQNQQQYKKKYIKRTEQRVYVKGKIEIRYWALQEDRPRSNILNEAHYKLCPVEAMATIADTEIHPVNIPRYFRKAYSEAELFQTPVPQPINCKIASSNGLEYYRLHVNDIRIIDPTLGDITKHEKQSLGTLYAEFYGYILQVHEKECTEIVTECHGETGAIERKTEDGVDFFRNEYYHKDCSKYWGPWVRIPKSTFKTTGTNKESHHTEGKKAVNSSVDIGGCLGFLWIPVLMAIVIAFPQLALFFIGLALVSLLFSASEAIFNRILPFIGLLIMLYFIYSAFSRGNSAGAVRRNFKPSQDTFITRFDPVPDTATKGAPAIPDTMITHDISWTDYDSNRYSIALAVLSSDARSSASDHANFLIKSGNSLTPAYHYLERNDQVRLRKVYSAFDSIRVSDTLNEQGFAKMVVSCIQSIPYYLVTERSCSDDFSDDEFSFIYLKECNRDCCLGSQRYGIRAPAEFIADLKGDCDTRALIIYSILKNFNYNVAILCSEYYKHAIIAINFKSDLSSGLSMKINGRNYLLWETTNTGFRPGQIPPENANLDYWEVGLLNEKNN